MKMYLDIARHIGTPLPRNTRANGREMSELRISYGSIDTTLAPQTSEDDAMTWDDDNGTLTYTALVATVYGLKNELYGLAAQIVELREQIERERGEL